MTKVKLSWIAAGILVGVAVTVGVIGGNRATALLRCQLWHATNDAPITAHGLLINVPSNWCPIDQDEEGLSLIMVPPSGEKQYLVTLVSPISDKFRNPATPPMRMAIMGEKLRLSDAPVTRMVGASGAVRLEYERGAHSDSASTMIVWLFPDSGTMVFSSRVPLGQAHHLDDLVSGFSPAGGV